MKKIGILTFQFAHNYGAVLQAYALKRTLEMMGAEVSVINYFPKRLADEYTINPLNYIINKKFGKILSIPWRIKQSFYFMSFRIVELGCGKRYRSLVKSTESNYDIIVVGSDQVWNADIVPCIEDYLLNGINVKKKIAFAASIGKDKFDFSICNKKLLEDFDLISLRERSAMDLFTNNGIDAKYVLDPVFLLSEQQWREFYQKKGNKTISEKYILYIDLMNDTKLKEIALKLKNEKGISVYAIHPTAWKFNIPGVKQLYDVGPYEYLYLIDHAEYVITNSFHGVAFSYIFKKAIFYYMDNELKNRIEDFLFQKGYEPSDVFFEFGKKNGENITDNSDTENILKKIRGFIQEED